MSASFFDLMKYAATGIASPDMTAYDKMRALAAFGGGKTQTLTGQPPLSFRANGTPLISWSMKGNGQQNGTPTPDNPVMPEFVGVRTGNLFTAAGATLGVYLKEDGTTGIASTYSLSAYLPIDESKSYIISSISDITTSGYHGFYDINKNLISTILASTETQTFSTPAGTAFIRVSWRHTSFDITEIMLNEGTVLLPYEPFGYKISLTNAGQTTPIYLGEVPTVRRIKKLVLTGDENWQAVAVTGGYAFLHSPSGSIKDESGVNVLSTHYKPAYRNNDGNIYITNRRIVIVDFSYASADDFKAYLAQQYANGTPVTVWYVLATPETAIVNEPLAKIGDYADELHSEDAGVTIPTAKGANTLTVDTELQPSEMTITYQE